MYNSAPGKIPTNTNNYRYKGKVGVAPASFLQQLPTPEVEISVLNSMVSKDVAEKLSIVLFHLAVHIRHCDSTP